MSDLKFYSSVLDKMPVGTSFSDSDHEVSKRDEGWKCDDCPSPTVKDSSSFCMSDPSEKYDLEKFAGAEIDPDDLDPRLLAFLPAGTRVADNDSRSDSRWHWYKTKSGRWIWTENYERAETLANNNKEMGYEDLSVYENLRPFRLSYVGTDEAPESVTVGEVFEADEATKLVNYAFKDADGDIWRFNKIRGCWEMSWANGSPSGILGGTLYGGHEPYTVYEEADSEAEGLPEGKAVFSAAEATDLKDCRFRDRDDDVWVFDDETELWRFILPDGELSIFVQHNRLSSALEPFTLVEGEPEPEPEIEPEPEPAEGTKLSAAEASKHKDTVFEDNDGDTWFFDHGMEKWRAIGSDWDYAWEELEPLFSPYTSIGSLSEFERPWTAEEASEFKDEALEDKDGDIWIYDVPSEQWKCGHPEDFGSSALDAYYQPYRIKKAAQARAAAESASNAAGKASNAAQSAASAAGTEEVTFEGSAKEAVELLDRIARSLESISNKLGDK